MLKILHEHMYRELFGNLSLGLENEMVMSVAYKFIFTESMHSFYVLRQGRSLLSIKVVALSRWSGAQAPHSSD